MKFNLTNPTNVLENIEKAIQDLGYSSKECSRYTLLLEEGIIKWHDCDKLEQEAEYNFKETAKFVKFTISAKGEKCYPFDAQTSEGDWIGQMHDRLLSGTGSEIGYRCKSGTNVITLTLPKKNHESELFKMNVWALAIPVAIQYLFTKIITATDSILMGILDQNSLAAISITGAFTSLYSILLAALAAGTTIFASQCWGKHDWKGINRVFSVSLRYSAICSILFFLPSFLFPQVIMSFYTNIPQLIDLGVQYLRIISFMFICNGFCQIYNGIMHNTGKVMKSTVFMVTSALVNFVLDLVLIFGLFGLKPMGIKGAALATMIASVVNLVLSSIDCATDKNMHISFSLSLAPESKKLIREYLAKSFPLVIQMVTWIIADNICTSIFGHMDTDIVAANGIITIVEDLGCFALAGIYDTCGILIGGRLGQNDFDTAKIYGKRYLKYIGIVGVFTVVGVLLLNVFAEFLPLDLSSKAFYYLHILLVIAAFEILFMGVNNVMNKGGFYAGGDTTALMIIDTVNMWLIIVPVGLLCHYVFKIPAIIIAIFLHMDELTSFPFKFARYNKYKWLRKIT